MPEDEITIITMDDMAIVFSETDAFGIHRESVSVELSREDPGSVQVNSRGVVEITLPASTEVQAFTTELRVQLEALGYQHDPNRTAFEAEGDTGDEPEGDDWLA